MRGLRRPPPPPAEPPEQDRSNNSRGRIDAPEDTPRLSSYRQQSRRSVAKNHHVPDLFNDQYSSGEENSDDTGGQVGRGGRLQREPPSDVDAKRISSRPSVDPPDEDLFANNRGRSVNPRGESPRSARTRSNSRGKKKHSKRPSAKLLKDEEELYEQYQDELFHQQPLYTQQLQQQPISSQYGQFNIAPVVEMTPLSTKKKKKKQHNSSFKSKGRYDIQQIEHDEDDIESSIDRVLDTIPGTANAPKTHEEYYNFSDNGEESSESDSDYDEERPLNQSSSSSLRFQRTNNEQSFREKCLNNTLLTLITLLSLIFIRDHTPWYKAYQHRLAIQKYQQSHTEDPMKVYNSADDDSMHARDHDPTGENVYFDVSAGERISDRPAKKSLHHGFMDENYENRPPAKNSGLATAKTAGVNAKNKPDKETEAFLASVKHSSSVDEKSEGKAANYVKTKPKSVVPPPPPKRPETGGEVDAFDVNSEDYENNNAQAKESESAGYEYSNKDEEFESAAERDGASSSFDKSHEESGSSLDMNAYLFNSKPETGQQDSSYFSPYNDFYGGASSESSFSATEDPEKPIQAIYSSSKHTSSSKPSSPSAFSSFDQSMTTQDVKTVYKDTFYRWNHPFRHDKTEDINGGFDIPVFWRIPRSASGVVEATMSYCYGLTLASALGAGFQDKTLHTIKVPAGAQFVNVDVSTPKGIEEAASLGLAISGLADIISSPFIYETTTLFQETPAAGKCFTLLRHPVDRAISQYHFYQKEDSVTPNNKQYQGMTIDEFAEAVAENNWMVRFLTGKRSGTLSWHDLEAAKEVFGRKCLVGLSEKAEESIRRYERFFRWGEGAANNEKQKESCLQTTLSKHDKRKDHPTYAGSDAWEVLRKKNEYDVLLYEYARNLYSQQSVLYENY